MKSLLLVLLLAINANAATYTVNALDPFASDSNPGTLLLPFKTLKKAATVAAPCDTVMVGPGGVYDERVTPAKSGTAACRIMFIASAGTRPIVRGFTLTNRTYISVSGFELTSQGVTADTGPVFILSGSYGIRIVGNLIHDTVSNSAAIKSSLTSCGWLYVGGNTLVNIGVPWNRMVGAELKCDDSLVENNDISHTQDFVRMFGSRNVVRGNTWHDSPANDAPNAHVDGFQGFCSGGVPNVATNAMLIEGNHAYNNLGPDEHFMLINATVNCGGSNHVIVRQNLIHDIGESFYTADTNQQGPSAFHKVYNNTVARVGRSTNISSTVFCTGVVGCSVLNNIFVDIVLQSGNRKVYSFKTNDTTSGGGYNLAYQSSGPVNWANPINSEFGKVLNRDPLFVAVSDFRLRTGSPAIAAAGPLTVVGPGDTGTGETLALKDAHFFQPGWAGVTPDCIAIGTPANVACIVSIDYGANTAVLASPIVRRSGDKVWLVRNSSGAVVGQNIGAF